MGHRDRRVLPDPLSCPRSPPPRAPVLDERAHAEPVRSTMKGHRAVLRGRQVALRGEGHREDLLAAVLEVLPAQAVLREHAAEGRNHRRRVEELLEGEAGRTGRRSGRHGGRDAECFRQMQPDAKRSDRTYEEEPRYRSDWSLWPFRHSHRADFRQTHVEREPQRPGDFLDGENRRVLVGILQLRRCLCVTPARLPSSVCVSPCSDRAQRRFSATVSPARTGTAASFAPAGARWCSCGFGWHLAADEVGFEPTFECLPGHVTMSSAVPKV